MLDSNVLLLNQNFEPITVCSVKRAILMVWNGKAEIVETTGLFIRTVKTSFDIPSIIRLLFFANIIRKWDIQLTKQNILRRDHKICQYCGKTDALMTLDHLIPRSLGGKDTWENLVCACSSCNNKKGDRTPQEAGMKLLRQPQKPNVRAFHFLHKGSINAQWNTYLKL